MIKDNQIIKSDKKRIQQVLLNLISNSLKFTGRKGQIKIQLELKGKDKKTLKLSVSDNGIGIREIDQDKIFKLFGAVEH